MALLVRTPVGGHSSVASCTAAGSCFHSICNRALTLRRGSMLQRCSCGTDRCLASCFLCADLWLWGWFWRWYGCCGYWLRLHRRLNVSGTGCGAGSPSGCFFGCVQGCSCWEFGHSRCRHGSVPLVCIGRRWSFCSWRGFCRWVWLCRRRCGELWDAGKRWRRWPAGTISGTGHVETRLSSVQVGRVVLSSG